MSNNYVRQRYSKAIFLLLDNIFAELLYNDFRLRGPGNYFGEEQSGFLSLEYADFETDYKIWESAKEDADDYFPKYMSGEEKSIRFNDLIIENAKNGFNSNQFFKALNVKIV